MPNLSKLEAAIPVAPLKLVVLESATALGSSVNSHLIDFRRSIKNVAKNDPAFESCCREPADLNCAKLSGRDTIIR